MCPVQWGACPARHQPCIPFASVPPNRVVMLVTRPTDHVVVHLHFSQERNTSMPCMGEECQVHHLPLEVYAYAGGLLYDSRDRSFRRCIVPLGDPGGELAQHDYTGMAIEIGRKHAADKKGKIVLLREVKQFGSPRNGSLATFDVRPFLLRRWGLFREAELLGCSFHAPVIDQAEGGNHDS